MLIFVLPADLLPNDRLMDGRTVTAILPNNPRTGNTVVTLAPSFGIGYPSKVEFCSPSTPMEVKRGEWDYPEGWDDLS